MYIIKRGTKFKKDYKKYINNDSDKQQLKNVLEILISWNQLPEQFKDHFLKWRYLWYKECHIKPDLLLIYKLNNNELELLLFRLWSHSELF